LFWRGLRGKSSVPQGKQNASAPHQQDCGRQRFGRDDVFDLADVRGVKMSGAVSGLVHELSGKVGNAARVAALRAGRKLSGNRPVDRGFFDSYPRFFESSETTAFANRLNQRYRACIEWNAPLIRGKRVLDIASHDGRWSFAAAKAGATHVTGLEARQHLIEAARANLAELPQDSFDFRAGDAFELLDRVEPGSIDTVLCLGFFYHVANHMLLLSKIERLKPAHIVIDTAVAADPRSVVVFQVEDHEFESDAARTDEAQKKVLAGIPSKAALVMMLESFGWSPEFYDWHGVGIRNWTHIEDYQEATRVTVRATT
jgi:2-polyprenyl-3-methyl-5-hydroxy-6-metoxy-1,4-benzoquinol methylase